MYKKGDQLGILKDDVPDGVMDGQTNIKQNREIVRQHLSIQMEEPHPEDILFQHSALCQTHLPYRQIKDKKATYIRKQGRLTTVLTPHQIENSEGKMIDVGLPYGSKSRLILYSANTLALQRKTNKVFVGRDMADFIRNLNLRGTTGRYNNDIKEQLIRLKKTSLSIHFKGDQQTILEDRFIFTTIGFPSYGKSSDPFKDIIVVKDNLNGIWLEFDYKYYESLATHSVPMDARGIKICARNARALDIYAWLVYRLQKIKNPNSGDFIPWKSLWDQFGSDVSRFDNFKMQFMKALELAYLAYPEAKFHVGNRTGMTLFPSKQSVPSKIYQVS